MFRFAHPEYLYLLALVALLSLGLVLFLRWQRRSRARLAQPQRLKALFGEEKNSRQLPFTLLSLTGLTLMVIALADPQSGGKPEKVKKKTMDIVFAMDVSRSMDVEDIKPSRLERARGFAARLSEKLAGDRMGLVIFAGNAYMQCPLTTDASALRMYINALSSSQVPRQGTALAEAITSAHRLLRPENAKGKVAQPGTQAVILISDGETHDEGDIAAADKLAADGISLYTVGVGTPEGAHVPMYWEGQQMGDLSDAGEEPVISRLNEDMLRDLAATGKGRYYHLSLTGSTEQELAAALAKLQREEAEQITYTGYTSYFMWFLAAGLALILLDRKRRT